jgi:4-phytase/acid phosphatase
MLDTIHSRCVFGWRHRLPTVRTRVSGILAASLWLTLTGVAAWPSPVRAQDTAVPAAAAPPPPGTLIKFVVLSRHGVRPPLESSAELQSWTATSEWPTWSCPNPYDPKRDCQPGWLTPRGATLARQMGTHYQDYLKSILPPDRCPTDGEVWFWADLDERTVLTGLSLLHGFRLLCLDTGKYLHTTPIKGDTPAKGETDRIFHPVGSDGRCTLDIVRAQDEINARAGGSLAALQKKLEPQLKAAQDVLQCCQPKLCQESCNNVCPHPKPERTQPAYACTLSSGLPSCLVCGSGQGRRPTQVEAGGALQIASTFSETLLLEYANGFAAQDVGWGRIQGSLTPLLALHATVFDVEQRADYVAKLQGSMLMKKILLALQSKTDGAVGTAPAGAKFVAYVGHDTNIANVAGILDLHWSQTQSGYQPDEIPPASALTFELRKGPDGEPKVYVSYVAQSLQDMRDLKGDRPVRTPVSVPQCSAPDDPNYACPLRTFEKLLDKPGTLDPNCL